VLEGINRMTRSVMRRAPHRLALLAMLAMIAGFVGSAQDSESGPDVSAASVHGRSVAVHPHDMRRQQGSSTRMSLPLRLVVRAARRVHRSPDSIGTGVDGTTDR
jgi:hypothetical protein